MGGPFGNTASTEQISLQLLFPVLITTYFVQASNVDPYGTSGVRARNFNEKQ